MYIPSAADVAFWTEKKKKKEWLQAAWGFSNEKSL